MRVCMHEYIIWKGSLVTDGVQWAVWYEVIQNNMILYVCSDFVIYTKSD